MSIEAVFVDETKAKRYVLAAVTMRSEDKDHVRRIVRGLNAPGQSRIHMKSEKSPRRHLILSTLVGLGLRAAIYRADSVLHRTEVERRRACLDRTVRDIAGSPSHLVLESDRSQDSRDRQQLIELSRVLGCQDNLRYEHLPAVVEPLLGIPDAVAWAWARGGDWQRRIRPIIDRVTDV